MARFQPGFTSSPKRGSCRCVDMSMDNTSSEMLDISYDNSRYNYDVEVFEDYEHPVGEELDQAIDEVWGDWVPPHGGRSEQSCAPPPPKEFGKAPDERDMSIVERPMPAHTFVPKWVYYARNNDRDMFVMAMKYYFKCYRWPLITEMPIPFMKTCFANGILPDQFERTAGFAPIWLFFLKDLVLQRKLHHSWFDHCISVFFETGRLPEMSTLPKELHEACDKIGIRENNFIKLADK